MTTASPNNSFERTTWLRPVAAQLMIRQAAMHRAADYLVTAHVRLSNPIRDGVEPEAPPLLGYFRIFGMLVSASQLRSSLEAAVDDGTVDWPGTEYVLVNRSTLDPDIRGRIHSPDANGVWYTSGKNFYSDDSDDAPN